MQTSRVLNSVYSVGKFQKLYYHGLLGNDNANSLLSGLNPCALGTRTLLLVVVLECRGMLSKAGLASEVKADHLEVLPRDISQCSRVGFLQSNGKGPVETPCWAMGALSQCLQFNRCCVNVFTYHWLVQMSSLWLCTSVYALSESRGRERSKEPLSSPFPFSLQLHFIFYNLSVVRARWALLTFWAFCKSRFRKLAECSYVLLLF